MCTCTDATESMKGKKSFSVDDWNASFYDYKAHSKCPCNVAMEA
jgi:hypothetical protein